MEPTSTALHTEIRKIAHLQGLIFCRYYLLLTMLLCLPYFFAHRYGLYCMYIFFFTLLAPSVIEEIPSKKTIKKNNILTTLKKEYGYHPLRYYSLQITFWLSNLLLLVWQIRNHIKSTVSSFAKELPFLILAGHLICYLFLSYYYQFKLHYQLKNNRW